MLATGMLVDTLLADMLVVGMLAYTTFVAYVYTDSIEVLASLAESSVFQQILLYIVALLLASIESLLFSYFALHSLSI